MYVATFYLFFFLSTSVCTLPVFFFFSSSPALVYCPFFRLFLLFTTVCTLPVFSFSYITSHYMLPILTYSVSSPPPRVRCPFSLFPTTPATVCCPFLPLFSSLHHRVYVDRFFSFSSLHQPMYVAHFYLFFLLSTTVCTLTVFSLFPLFTSLCMLPIFTSSFSSPPPCVR